MDNCDRAIEWIIKNYKDGPYLFIGKDNTFLRRFKIRSKRIYDIMQFRGKSKKLKLELPNNFAEVTINIEKINSSRPDFVKSIYKEVNRITSKVIIVISKSELLKKEIEVKILSEGFEYCDSLSKSLLSNIKSNNFMTAAVYHKKAEINDNI